jgi:hypothetical protein
MRHVTQYCGGKELDEAALKETRKTFVHALKCSTMKIDELEKSNVVPGTSDAFVHCKTCDCEVRKLGVVGHFTANGHDLKASDVKKWVCVMDGLSIRSNSGRKSVFELLYKADNMPGSSTAVEPTAASIDEAAEDSDYPSSLHDLVESDLDSDVGEADARWLHPVTKKKSYRALVSKIASRRASTDSRPSSSTNVNPTRPPRTMPTSYMPKSYTEPQGRAHRQVVAQDSPVATIIAQPAQANLIEVSTATDDVGIPRNSAAGAVMEQVRQFGKKLEEVKKLVTPKPSTCSDQKLKVRDIVKEWKVSTGGVECLRNRWPFPHESWQDENFQKYLETRCMMKKSGAEGVMVQMGRLKAMFDVELDDTCLLSDAGTSPEICEKSFLVNLVRSRAIEELLDLPAFSPNLSSTHKFITCIKHLQKYLSTQFFDLEDVVSMTFMTRLVDHSLHLHTKNCNVTKKVHLKAKLRRDAEKKNDAAPSAITSAAVIQAMIDLALIVDKYNNLRTMPARERVAATALILFIIYNNGLAGRPMEWSTFPRADALEQLAKHPTWVKMSQFKTAKFYGEVGKAIAPGTLQAIKAFATLPTVDGNANDLLFPVTPEASKITWRHRKRKGVHTIGVNNALRAGFRKYLPGYPLLSPTNLRKMIMSKTRTNELSFDWQVLSLLDTHSEQVALSHYDLSQMNPEELAKQGQRLFLKYMTTPAEWPSAEAIAASGRTAAEVTKRSYKFTSEVEDTPDLAATKVSDVGMDAELPAESAPGANIGAPSTPIDSRRSRPTHLPSSVKVAPPAAGVQRTYKHFTKEEVQWIVEQHAALPQHSDGQIDRPADKPILKALIQKGVTSGELRLHDREFTEEVHTQMYNHVRSVLRAEIRRSTLSRQTPTLEERTDELWKNVPKRSAPTSRTIQRQLTRTTTPPPAKSTGVKMMCRDDPEEEDVFRVIRSLPAESAAAFDLSDCPNRWKGIVTILEQRDLLGDQAAMFSMVNVLRNERDP